MKMETGINGTGALLTSSPIKLLDFEPAADNVRAEVLAGLASARKTLPCKLFYNERGSQLFDAICELPEYYPTRTELAIMREYGHEMADAMGRRTLLVEYGSGSSLKTRMLLDHLPDAAGYVPIDISRSHLLHAARALAASYPHIPVRPVCADYTRPLWLPTFKEEWPARVVAYFPGSTIGNFEPEQALAFLKSVRATCGRGSGLLIGVDLKKDPALLHAAYNDSAGVTAAFNLNILERINRDIGSDFDVETFAHNAFYNPALGRMEMHLVSDRLQAVSLGDGVFVRFEDGESIHTESCHKYTLDTFAALAKAAGYRRAATWTDANGGFSVQYLVSDGRDNNEDACDGTGSPGTD
jgi:dimethylhistidine N-methyltransferase